MKRSAPLLRSRPEAATLTIKPKRCTVCTTRFIPTRPMQVACSPICAQQYAATLAAGKAKEKRRQMAANDRATREALLTRSDWIKRAQAAFNAFIRARDRKAGYACICCRQPLDWGAAGVRGHKVDAGHYRSTGSAPHLRFDERNCHAQRVVCNRHGAGRAVDYRIGLLQRIGADAVEAIEADQEPRMHSIAELQSLTQQYRKETRRIEKEIAG